MAASRKLASSWVMTEEDGELIDWLGRCYADPELFVDAIFLWNEGDLAGHDGPDVWQREVLQQIGAAVQANTEALPDGTADMKAVADAIQIAVASGHGVGKSALVAWIILWFMSTRDHPQIPVTANTQTQLLTKTWRELARWHRRAQNVHWFEWTATRFTHRAFKESWFAAAIPWSKQHSEAFAGTHEKHVLLIMDEASAVPDMIWEVSDGAMSTPGAIRLAFGNPTRNTGRFAQCFGKFKARWWTKQVDSRTSRLTNKVLIQQAIADYGEDSDYVRMRWRGVFPRSAATQFISSEDIFLAQQRRHDEVVYAAQPRVISVDVARHGGCQTVITKRQGRKVWPQIKLRIPDLVEVSRHVAAAYDEFEGNVPIQVDATGMGWGVVDSLRSWGYPVNGVEVGRKADREEQYHDRRSELADKMKKFVSDGAELPPDPELADELATLAHRYDDKLRLELRSKEYMEKTLDLPSPDCADSLMISFAAPLVAVAENQSASERRKRRAKRGERYNWQAGA